MRERRDERGQVGTLEDDPAALRAVAWKTTEQRYKNAAERFVQLKTRQNVDVGPDDKSDDFSKEKPVVLLESPATLEVDIPAWESRVRALSARRRQRSRSAMIWSYERHHGRHHIQGPATQEAH